MIRLKPLIERFADVAKIADKGKGQWVDLSEPAVGSAAKKDFPMKENLFDLVDFAYKNTLHEPNVSVKSPNDVLAFPYDYWEAINIDEAPDADAVLFGSEKNGIKIGGIGHDGRPLSKSHLVKHIIEVLKISGYWIEASGPLGKVLWQAGVPTIEDPQKLQKLFPGSSFENVSADGSYIRTLKSGKKQKLKECLGDQRYEEAVPNNWYFWRGIKRNEAIIYGCGDIGKWQKYIPKKTFPSRSCNKSRQHSQRACWRC